MARQALWVRQSPDDEPSSPQRPFPKHVGRNGAASIVVDSDDLLHIFFGQRIHGEKIDTHGMWRSTLRNGTWTEPQPIVSGPMVQGTNDAAFDPGDAHAIADQGNVLLVTWRTIQGMGRIPPWYAYTQLDTPAWPLVPLPMPKSCAPDTHHGSDHEAAPTATPSPVPAAVKLIVEVAGQG